MAHKILKMDSNHQRWSWQRGRYQRVGPDPKPYYTEAQVATAFQIPVLKLRKCLMVYRITLPEIDMQSTTYLQMRAEAMRHKLKPMDILRVRNQTVRRALMDAYGIDDLIKDGGGETVQQDDFGILWEIKRADGRDKSMKWVEVVNTTAEPDGTFARYFLRVPPRMQTARDAIAWIGGLDNLSDFGGFEAES